ASIASLFSFSISYPIRFLLLIDYECDVTNAIIPPTINNGKAMYISPPTTIPINITGKKITVQSNFIIPQDALNPKTKNFPTNQIIQIANNNDNIFLLLLKLILICVFHFFCSFSAKYSDVFFMPSLLLNAGFFSIFSIIRINRTLCAASI
ncbi:hypothetical protein, partial [Blautia massiliensis (ex Durand et al. 2017)]|uniref:hypothetical protein n=1 Tax=Blautia massiliensis (ex Durand et al. 2017) TaxID=1737424 RepID=UPI001A9BECAC